MSVDVHVQMVDYSFFLDIFTKKQIFKEEINFHLDFMFTQSQKLFEFVH